MNEIDELMHTDPLVLSDPIQGKAPTDKIIAYMREQRANFEKGIKPKKVEGPKKKIDLASLGLKKTPVEPVASIKRRSW